MGAKVFAYKVFDPERYGVVEFSEDFKVLSIEEKPKNTKIKICFNWSLPYDSRVSELATTLKPSARGELEITDLNNLYLMDNSLEVTVMGSGDAWLDAGTPDSLEAAHFVQTIQHSQSTQIGCPEAIALEQGFISKEEFEKIILTAPKK